MRFYGKRFIAAAGAALIVFAGVTAAFDVTQVRAAQAPQKDKLIFIGDSRTVGMHMAVSSEDDDDNVWSCRDSMGYDWMVKTGVPDVEQKISTDTDVIFLMGVNDPGHVNEYVDYINEKAKEWSEEGATTWFVSVNPVDDDRSPLIKNAHIEAFNDTMQKDLVDVGYIDTYDDILSTFTSPDGIHYYNSTYEEIYHDILGRVDGTEELSDWSSRFSGALLKSDEIYALTGKKQDEES